MEVSVSAAQSILQLRKSFSVWLKGITALCRCFLPLQSRWYTWFLHQRTRRLPGIWGFYKRWYFQSFAHLACQGHLQIWGGIKQRNTHLYVTVYRLWQPCPITLVTVIPFERKAVPSMTPLGNPVDILLLVLFFPIWGTYWCNLNVQPICHCKTKDYALVTFRHQKALGERYKKHLVLSSQTWLEFVPRTH